jgi:RNA polymerase sigma factor (TIGR02999 family)
LIRNHSTFKFPIWRPPPPGPKPVPSDPTYPVTDLLARWSEGDVGARDALVPIVYDQLRRIARKCLLSQRSGHTLQPTALVHEAYLRIAKGSSLQWQNRAHFFAVAAQMMRQILVDHARRASAGKRGGGAITLSLNENDDVAAQAQNNLDLIALDTAMKRLATLDERQSRIVELRFFGGLSIEETAHVMEISPATAKREWATARVWLHREIGSSAEA